MLEGDDTRGGAFALFLRPHPGAFRQLKCPHPGEFAHFFKKNANARWLAPGGGEGHGHCWNWLMHYCRTWATVYKFLKESHVRCFSSNLRRWYLQIQALTQDLTQRQLQFFHCFALNQSTDVVSVNDNGRFARTIVLSLWLNRGSLVLLSLIFW